MNNTPSLNEINKNSTMDPNMLNKYYKLKLMNDFYEYQVSKSKNDTIRDIISIKYESFYYKRYRNDINMLSPYRISPNNTKKRSKKAKIDDIGDLKGPQMTSIDSETNSKEPVKNKKNKLKGGSIQENDEINEHYLDKILKINST